MAERNLTKKEINSIINYILKTYEKEDIDFVMTRHINGDLDYDDLYQNDDALDSIKEFLDEEIDIENDGTPIEQVIIQEAIDELFSLTLDDISIESYDNVVERLCEELDIEV